MLSYNITAYKGITMVGKVFRENGINLIYGESGVGKTVSSVKALNKENLIPILLDFDDNDSPISQNIEFIHINGTKYIKNKSTATIPTNTIVIIDTWEMFLANNGTIEDIKRIRNNNNTVIIVAHSKDIATKRDIPDIDPKYSNHFASKLFLEYKPKTTKADESFNLIIKKLRGYKGSRIIKNWMR